MREERLAPMRDGLPENIFAIDFRSVTKRYDSHEFALSDVNLRIEQGEFVFCTGPNGAGKTTLLRLISVMEKPTSGELFISGVSSRRMKRRHVARLRKCMGIILQDLRLLRQRTVEENVRLALEVAGVPRGSHTAKLMRVLTYLGLSTKRNLYPPELSWGEQQKVAIARAIVNTPQILLADEPTEKLDGGSEDEILDILKEVNLWGATVILASHDPLLPVKGATRVVSLHAGTIVSDVKVGTPSPEAVAP
jgi:cell division transport system ATP-binding protein